MVLEKVRKEKKGNANYDLESLLTSYFMVAVISVVAPPDYTLASLVSAASKGQQDVKASSLKTLRNDSLPCGGSTIEKGSIEKLFSRKRQLRNKVRQIS